MAWAVTDLIVDAVIPFIEAYIKSPDWHQREAAPPPIAMGQPPSTSSVGQSLGQSPQQMQQMQQQDPGPRSTSQAGYPGIGTMSLAASAPSPACGTSPGHRIGLGTVQLYGKAMRVTDIHPEHIDNYFDEDTATSRNAELDSQNRRLEQVYAGVAASHVMIQLPGYHIPDDSYAGTTLM
ncbi:hypothetical protein EDD17DRAFT_1513114 [Pisolithus thermaeus]|nr:hypothetical protein EDD17DRAFT_1513114 [Pisolithus thermaeus]